MQRADRYGTMVQEDSCVRNKGTTLSHISQADPGSTNSHLVRVDTLIPPKNNLFIESEICVQ